MAVARALPRDTAIIEHHGYATTWRMLRQGEEACDAVGDALGAVAADADDARWQKEAAAARRAHVSKTEGERSASVAAASREKTAVARRLALAEQREAAAEARAVPMTVSRSRTKIDYAHTRFHSASEGATEAAREGHRPGVHEASPPLANYRAAVLFMHRPTS